MVEKKTENVDHYSQFNFNMERNDEIAFYCKSRWKLVTVK